MATPTSKYHRKCDDEDLKRNQTANIDGALTQSRALSRSSCPGICLPPCDSCIRTAGVKGLDEDILRGTLLEKGAGTYFGYQDNEVPAIASSSMEGETTEDEAPFLQLDHNNGISTTHTEGMDGGDLLDFAVVPLPADSRALVPGFGLGALLEYTPLQPNPTGFMMSTAAAMVMDGRDVQGHALIPAQSSTDGERVLENPALSINQGERQQMILGNRPHCSFAHSRRQSTSHLFDLGKTSRLPSVPGSSSAQQAQITPVHTITNSSKHPLPLQNSDLTSGASKPRGEEDESRLLLSVNLQSPPPSGQPSEVEPVLELDCDMCEKTFPTVKSMLQHWRTGHK